MSFGLSDTGFNRPTLQDLLDACAADYLSTIGPINDGDDSVYSQVIRPPMTQLAEAWEVLEAVYQAGGPNGASGISLDTLAGLNFITRIPARRTAVVVRLTGDYATTLNDGAQVSVSSTGEVFQSDDTFSINENNALRLTYAILVATLGTTYSFRIGTTTYQYTTPGSGSVSLASVAAGMAAAMADDQSVTVVDNADGTLLVTSADLVTPFTALNLSSSSADELRDIEGYGLFYSLEDGPVLCLAGSVDTIETPVSGLTAVTNPLDGDTGRLRETDKELRTRRLQTLARGGKATNAAIKAKLLSGEIEGIGQVFVYENNTDVVDIYGRPAHSIEVVVEGGNDEEIATAIHETRASGIVTFGNINSDAGVTILDDQGFEVVVKFSRPVPKYAWIQANYVLYDEEVFPEAGEELIAAALLALGNLSAIGKDFIIQRFINPVVSVEGVGEVFIQIDVTDSPSDTPTLQTSNIPIGPSEILVFDSTRIAVYEGIA